MKTMPNNIRTLKIAVAIIIVAIVFYPKPWVVGGFQGGPIGPGQTAYREQYSCAGIKLIVPVFNCADCGAMHPCFGITFHKTCSIENYDLNAGFTSTPVPCRQSTR